MMRCGVTLSLSSNRAFSEGGGGDDDDIVE
jgi:hypothetical protein